MRSLLPHVTAALTLATIALLRADPADVAGSRDYPDFPRLPGYILTDYVEDNPSDFDFPVSRPTTLDSDHVETVHVHGHRYIIRYELGPGTQPPSLLQAQRFYEQQATAAGYTIEKTGAVADVSETFHRIKDGQETWAYLEPDITVNVLTMVESSQPETPAPPPLQIVGVSPTITVPEPTPAPPPPPKPAITGDQLYKELSDDGRVIVPIDFLPGKDQIDAASMPVVDSIVDMMKMHPEISLRIESHTDNTGDADANMRLSSQRAYAIREMLIAARIEENRVDAVGVGGLQPIADNSTEEGRAKNRRIELVIKKKFGGTPTAEQ